MSISQEDQIIAAQVKEITALKQRLESLTRTMNEALKEDRVIRRAREWRNADDRRKECRERFYEFLERIQGKSYDPSTDEPAEYRRAAAAAGVARRKLYEAIDEMDRTQTNTLYNATQWFAELRPAV